MKKMGTRRAVQVIANETSFMSERWLLMGSGLSERIGLHFLHNA